MHKFIPPLSSSQVFKALENTKASLEATIPPAKLTELLALQRLYSTIVAVHWYTRMAVPELRDHKEIRTFTFTFLADQFERAEAKEH